jgi:hypothetical protein
MNPFMKELWHHKRFANQWQKWLEYDDPKV